eukprot:1195716-Prorocentrum_minimum.AAC.1
MLVKVEWLNKVLTCAKTVRKQLGGELSEFSSVVAGGVVSVEADHFPRAVHLHALPPPRFRPGGGGSASGLGSGLINSGAKRVNSSVKRVNSSAQTGQFRRQTANQTKVRAGAPDAAPHGDVFEQLVLDGVPRREHLPAPPSRPPLRGSIPGAPLAQQRPPRSRARGARAVETMGTMRGAFFFLRCCEENANDSH